VGLFAGLSNAIRDLMSTDVGQLLQLSLKPGESIRGETNLRHRTRFPFFHRVVLHTTVPSNAILVRAEESTCLPL
jgi:hypothetical protein